MVFGSRHAIPAPKRLRIDAIAITRRSPFVPSAPRKILLAIDSPGKAPLIMETGMGFIHAMRRKVGGFHRTFSATPTSRQVENRCEAETEESVA